MTSHTVGKEHLLSALIAFQSVTYTVHTYTDTLNKTILSNQMPHADVLGKYHILPKISPAVDMAQTGEGLFSNMRNAPQM